ncbi:MAG: hypothetical protein IKY65_01520 [Rikenellaceae bacterium]|nr:hypothetical protein [Rikenellaceae bacterium]
MTKALFIYALSVTALLLLVGSNRQRLRSENQRLNQNIATLTSDVELYRTRSGESAAEVRSLRLRQSELEQTNEALTDQIDQLKIRLRHINSLATAATQTVVEFSTQIPDTVLRRPVVDTIRLPLYTDTWNSVQATLIGDRIEGRFSSVDTLHQVVYRVPHRFLFIRYGTKELRQVITSSNPSTRLVYSSHITIERGGRKRRF